MKTRKHCIEGEPQVKYRFADIHCHPHMRSFNWLHKPWAPEKSKKYNPWWVVLPKFKSASKGKRASAYSQCDMAQIINGNLKLAIVSLYPLEKGWVTGRKTPIKMRPVDLQKILGDNDFNEAVSDFLSGLVKPVFNWLGRSKQDKIALRDFMQSLFMKLPIRKINFFQSDKYDYFTELQAEREYLLRMNGVESRTEIYIPPVKKMFFNKNRIRKKCPLELDAKGTYEFAKNGRHAEELIKEGKTAFVMSIEGTNVFNADQPIEKVMERIAEVKAWEQPLFFVTFSHHFNNYLAGHAHSLPDVANNLIDQDESKNEGFTENGMKVLRYLLAIDDTNNKRKDAGRRVLIDVKHLSVRARKEYYNEVIEPCLKKGDVIPVIASHVAYSGITTLDKLIENLDHEVDGAMADRFGSKFNSWNINVCDEDILTCFKTGGLIGINLDQRILGISKEDQDDESKHIQYVWQNMRALMMVVLESEASDLPDKKLVTNLVCLGTDFDGYIDPANRYATVNDFGDLRDDLVKIISKDEEKDKLLQGLTPDELAEKICFTNAMDFVIKNFK
jgi:microsomal dipeptidase-like Zn-dependent dipeptidase